MMKKSSSKVSVTKGSVNHIGTTPYRFRIDLFVSYLEKVKSVTEACITLERRGKVESTKVVTVEDGKAVIRDQITMECTLFRKNQNNGGKSSRNQPKEPAPDELLTFDEKKAKLYLRKGGPQGKAVAKLSLNLADYIKGAQSSVFADMKLSDGTIVVTKVEATMIAMDKKKSKFGSKTGSGFSDAMSVDDSLCFDEEDLENAQRLHEIPSLNNFGHMASSSSMQPPVTPRMTGSPVTSASNTPPHIGVPESPSNLSQRRSTMSSSMSPAARVSFSPQSFANSEVFNEKKGRFSKKIKDPEKSGSTIKDKLKIKFKKKDKDKEKGDKLERQSSVADSTGSSEKMRPEPLYVDQMRQEPVAGPGSSISGTPSELLSPGIPVQSPVSFGESAELKDLRKQVETLKKENNKLKKAKKEAMEEIDALRADLQGCEEQLEAIERKDTPQSSAAEAKIAKLQGKIKDKEKKIEALKAQNESLMDEMEEQHTEMKSATKRMEDKERKIAEAEVNRMDKARQDQALLEQIRVEQGKLDRARLEQQRANEQRIAGGSSASGGEEAAEEVAALRKKVGELEVALQREPTFMDVVNELKVMKMTVALANMEKEQAIFELQNMKQQFRSMTSEM